MCASPFGEWRRANGGREFRGVRTERHTYVRTLDGPWLLYDNLDDPHQLENLCNPPRAAALQERLEEQLRYRLRRTGDDFAPGPELVRRCGCRVGAAGTVGYQDPPSWGQVSRSARL